MMKLATMRKHMRGKVKRYLHTPIYIFQMGKVGSKSLKATLSAKYRGAIVHAHSYKGMSFSERALLTWRKRLYLPIYVICPIREPLSRNVSAFFQTFKRDTGFDFTEQEWTSSELKDLFLKYYPHKVCNEWFDKHFRTTFDLDIFSKPFPIERKWNVYKHRSIKVLIFRADLERDEQLRAVSEFIDCKIDNWTFANVSEEKEYSKLHKNFCRSVTLPDIYISLMCKSRFCQHFWSLEEIVAFSSHWKGKRGNARDEDPAAFHPLQ